MVDNIKYANAMAEVLYYLKGIKQEDVEKIPKKLIKFLKDNASKNYECKFDYTKPLKHLELQDETKGFIAMICLNYWCENEEQKQKFIRQLYKNETNYQEELKKKYDIEKIFEHRKSINKDKNENQIYLVKYNRNIIEKIWQKIKRLFKM